MTAGRRPFAFLLWLCAFWLSTGFSAPAAARAEDPSDGRQILVMQAMAPAHLRPNYDQGSGYGDDPGREARKRKAKRIARKLGLTLAGNWPMPLIGLDCFVMTVPDGRSVNDVVDKLSGESGVLWAQPVQSYRTKGTPPSYNDPLLRAQPVLLQWRLRDLHQIATGRGVTIGVIDSGVDSSHPDLQGQIAANRNFIEGEKIVAEQHGTAVAGIIAAKANNRAGIVGIAPQAHLLALRACRQTANSKPAVCDSLSLAKALHFALENKANVINLSLSGPPDRLLGRLLRIGLDRGVALVAPYDPDLPKGGFPASFAGVIAVSDQDLPVQSATVYTAPGRDVPTAQVGGGWYLVNGNSFAAAHVSGLVALLRNRRPRSRPSDLVLARSGKGAIDACATLARVSAPCDCSCAVAVDARSPVQRLSLDH